MSANNWRTCPKCVADAESKQQAKIDKLKKQYGKIDPDEYERQMRDARTQVEHQETLREDYEIGIFDTDDLFHVSYSAYCKVCGFEFTFSYNQDPMKATQSKVK